MTFKNFGLLVVIGILLFLLWQKSCNSNPTPIPDNKYKDTLSWLRDTLELNRADETKWKETALAAEAHIVELGDKSDDAERKLAKANKEVNYWIGKVKDSDSVEPGNGWHNIRDIVYLDSLIIAAKQAQTKCANVIAIKDSIIGEYKVEVGGYKQIVKSMAHDTTLMAGEIKIYEHKVANLEQQVIARRKLYGGIEGYSTQKAFQSLQVGLLYADKKGNMIGASGGLFLDGSPIFGLKYYKLIQLKK